LFKPDELKSSKIKTLTLRLGRQVPTLAAITKSNFVVLREGYSGKSLPLTGAWPPRMHLKCCCHHHTGSTIGKLQEEEFRAHFRSLVGWPP
jgi:hypothetical protein